MKIAIDIRTLLQNKYTGISTYTDEMIRAILALDHESQYLLFSNSARQLTQDFPFRNLNTIFTRYPNKFFNAALVFLRRPKLDKFVGGCDLFWLPDINYCALSPKQSYVITVHDLSYLRNPEFFNWKHPIWKTMLGAKSLIRNATHILAVSESTKHDLIDLLNIPAEKITVTPLGISKNFARITDTDELARVRQKYNLPEQFLLYLGTIEPRKNIISIIESLAETDPAYPLVIAGRKGWKTGETLRAAKRMGRRVQLLDYVSAEDKPAIYSLAKIFIWPSFYEGFGLPPLEAQACGTPVITAANSSLLENFGESALMVNADNVHEISQAVTALLEDQALREYYVKKGLENARRFSWDNTAKLTLEAFEKLNNAKI